MFVLPEARTKELLALPESGMGFQLVEFITDDNRRHQGVAFNAEFIIRANEPCIHLLHESEVRQARVELEARMPYGYIREIRLLDLSRGSTLGYGVLEARAAYGAKFGPAKDAPVELTKIGDTFVRFSAFE